ncbi:M48 family metalloprotease [Nocardia sp. NRRL S-836]|uniref:M48 family metalloprotease n=1 Tax=Nocardia sp. NRRL S-836 TaxID=1519492 RepID=UPI0006C1F560|nr:M48 family metalloprotease [Nocardia sp. NRRL S-836]KOV79299.1 hypothetical protein ADL03_37455 [Nocardia sp. NRRL S-836]
MPESGRRRRPDASVAFELLLAVPVVVSSLAVMALLGQLVTPHWLVPVAWLASGAVVFLPAADRVLAHVLPPRQLEAVLAHELGHHLAGHSTASLVRWWYELPARLVIFVVLLVASVVLAVGRVFLRFGNAVMGFACIGVVVVLGVFALAASPWLLLVPVIAPLLALTSRHAELRADRVAAELGYGPVLQDVLQRWISDGHDDARARAGLRARMLASHPSCAHRMRRLREAA